MKTILFEILDSPKGINTSNMYNTNSYPGDGCYKVKDDSDQEWLVFIIGTIAWGVPWIDLEQLQVEGPELNPVTEVPDDFAIPWDKFLQHTAMVYNKEKLKEIK